VTPTHEAATKRWGLRLLQIGVTLLVTYFILRRVGVGWDDVRSLDSRWWRPHPGIALAASGVLFSGYALSALLWSRMAADLGAPAMRPARAVGLFMTANLGRYVPGKVWQILGLAYLSRSEGVGPVVAGTAAVLGQVFALGAAALVGSTALRWGGAGHPWVAWVAVLGLVGAIIAFAVPAVRRPLFRLLERWSGTPIDSDRLGLGFVLRWGSAYLLNWIIYAAAFWLFVTSYQPGVGFLEAGPAFAAAYLIGYLFLPAPAGLGVREGALTVLLTPALGAAAALAVAITSRLWATVVELVPAALMAPGVLARATATAGTTEVGG